MWVYTVGQIYVPDRLERALGPRRARRTSPLSKLCFALVGGDLQQLVTRDPQTNSLRYSSPTMISRVAGLDCDKRAAAGCSYFVVGDQFAFHYCPVIGRFNYSRNQMDWFIGRRWPQEFDCVVSGDCTGRVVQTETLHEVIRRGPIAMAVEQRADNSAAEHSRKRFLVGFRLPVSDYFLALWKAADVQPFFICRATTKTLHVWRVGFLDTFFVHDN